MKKILKIFLILVFLAPFSFALELEKIDSVMDRNIKHILNSLQKLPKKSTQEQTHNPTQIQKIAQEAFSVFDPIFDYSLMAQLALSKHYKNLTNSQKQEFSKVFEETLKHNFVDKLQLYRDEKVEVINGTKIKENRYVLKTSIILDGKENYILFKFYPKGTDWKIYDVDILGVSIIQTYRSQIDDILSKSDFATLLEKLKSITIASKE